MTMTTNSNSNFVDLVLLTSRQSRTRKNHLESDHLQRNASALTSAIFLMTTLLQLQRTSDAFEEQGSFRVFGWLEKAAKTQHDPLTNPHHTRDFHFHPSFSPHLFQCKPKIHNIYQK